MKRQYIVPTTAMLVMQQECVICAVSGLRTGGSGDVTNGR